MTGYSQSGTSDSARRRALLALVMQHYILWPGQPPPYGWADAIEHVDRLREMAELPAIRDLDRIIAEGSHLLSSRMIGGMQ